jgi:hypothetical protein
VSKKRKMTPRMLRRAAEDPLKALLLSADERLPVALLGDVGVAHMVAQELKKAMVAHEAHCDIMSEPPEHQELHAAVADVIKAVEIALDAAVNAAWQQHWVQTECKCARCQQRRQMENAHLS